MKASSRLRFVPSLEVLENRQVLAGGVAASVLGGKLVLDGDSRDNVVAIWQGAEPGTLVIAGGKSSSGAATTVNGQLGPVTVSGVTGGMNLYLHGGHDRAILTNVTVNGPVKIGLGTGNDAVIVRGNTPNTPEAALNEGDPIAYGPIDIRGQLRANGNEGNDALRLFNARVAGDVIFTSGDGNDVFQVDGVTGGTRLGGINVNLGAGDDLLNVKRVSVDRNLVAKDPLPVGDTATSSRLEVGSSTIAGHMNLNTNVPRGWVLIEGGGPTTQVTAGSIYIHADVVTMYQVSADWLRIETFDGDDNIDINQAAFHELSILMGAGLDTVTLGGVTTTVTTLIHGGDGMDTFNDLGNNLTDVHRYSIEWPADGW